MTEKVKRKKSKAKATDKGPEATEAPLDAVIEEKKVSKKRDKSKKDANHVHESKGQAKALRYLKLWYANHKGETDEPWKFEKCRQIWLLQNCYYDKKVPQTEFKSLLKYMATIQGRMRTAALDDAQQKLDLVKQWDTMAEEGKLDADIAKELKKTRPDEVMVKRAKKIVKKLSKQADE